MCQHRHQLSFGTGFQAQRFARMNQGLNHAAVLVNFDRINEEVIAVIAVGFPRTFERGVNRTQTVLQDLRETEQCRQTLALCFTSFH